MSTSIFSYEAARKIDIVEYLESLGFSPQKIRNNDYWYLSPLREEKESSFKVNKRLNVWYDHGIGRGGNIIDFGMMFHNCSFKELMNKLDKIFSFHPQISTVQQHHPGTQNQKDALEPKIKVIAAKPLSNLSLCSYLRDRKIPFDVAKKYCEEVRYELYGKRFFAIGFKNNSGGYELRNAHFKGSSSPKDIKLIEHSSLKEVAIFEGFFSFLSCLTLQQKKIPLTNFLILNSLSFFEKSRPIMESYGTINLFLDRDQAGISFTQRALEWNKKYIDQSIKYKNHKDLNEYLIHQSYKQKPGIQLGRHV